MKKTSTLLPIAILIVLATTIAVLELRRPDYPASNGLAQTTAVKPHVAGNPAQPIAPGKTARVAPPAPAPNVPPDRLDDAAPSVKEPSDESESVGSRDFAATYRELNQRFQGQEGDPRAVEMETQILNHLSQQTGIALTGIEVQCRSTICRVQLSGSDASEKSRLFGSLEAFGRVIGTSLKGPGGVAISEVFVERHHFDARP